MDSITPELALIDPDLAELARNTRLTPDDCLVSRAPAESLAHSRGVQGPSLLFVVAALVLAALIGTPALGHSSSTRPDGRDIPGSGPADGRIHRAALLEIAPAVSGTASSSPASPRG